jgi:AcrR family transcriptional regulator
MPPLSSVPSPEDRPPSTAANRRRQREQEIIGATRALFDERGVRDAQIEDIANAVGINRAIVYRHFTGKEELFVLTLVQYLDELRERLLEADDASADPQQRLRLIVGAFADYGLAYPAFVDCAQSIMRRQGHDLLAEVSEGALFRLGRAMMGCLRVLTEVIEAGVTQGEFHVDDPNLLANMFYASGLGSLQLARVGILVSESAPGIPTMSRITSDQVTDHIVSSVLGNVMAQRAPGA